MHTIIVGVDGSERSADALSVAYRLTTATDARMLLVHVVGVPSVTEAGLYEPYTDMLRDESAAMLRRMQSLVGAGGPHVGPDHHAGLAGAGHPGDRRAGARRAGRRRLQPRRPLRPRAAGRTGERLLTARSCPVAIVPRGLAGRAWSDLRVIGLADDAGRESRAARDAAVALARATGAALQDHRGLRRRALRLTGADVRAGLLRAPRRHPRDGAGRARRGDRVAARRHARAARDARGRPGRSAGRGLARISTCSCSARAGTDRCTPCSPVG